MGENGETKEAKRADLALIARVNAFEEFMPSFIPVVAKMWKRDLAFNGDLFGQIALQAIQRQPAIMECETLSVIGALRTCAEFSMYPDDVRGHCYLIPRWDKHIGMKRCNFMLGYLGYVYLFRRTGLAAEKAVDAERVYDGDEIYIEKGLHPQLKHVPKLESIQERALKLVYAIIHYKGGGSDFDYVLAHQIQEVERVYVESDSASSPWRKSDLSRSWMEKKTAIRQVLKLSPALDSDLASAVALDEKVDAGVDQNLNLMLDRSLADMAKTLLENKKTVDVKAIPEGAPGSSLEAFLRQRQGTDKELAPVEKPAETKPAEKAVETKPAAPAETKPAEAKPPEEGKKRGRKKEKAEGEATLKELVDKPAVSQAEPAPAPAQAPPPEPAKAAADPWGEMMGE